MNLQKKRFLKLSAAMTVVFLAFIAVTFVMAAAPKVYAAGEVAPEGTVAAEEMKEPLDPQAGRAFLSAAIVTCVSCVAAGIAVGMTGSAAF